MITEVRTEIATRLPAEWSPQSGVMLTWPHGESIWAETLNDIDKVFVHTTAAITRHEKVLISCFDRTHLQHVKQLLNAAKIDINNVRLYIAYSNDIWVRDHGPIAILHHDNPVLLDFVFNGWGNKYPANFDDRLTQSLVEQHAFGRTQIQQIDIVLEGGAIETDGLGTLLTTSRCLLSRNPRLNKDFMSMRLQQLFGCERILWLDHGYLAGDDTDGHIDTLARFINSSTICYVQCDDVNDENYTELQHMEDQLQSFLQLNEKHYELVPLPMPKARYARYDGRRLPLSYANFLIINQAVLVPVYDDPADTMALEIFKKLFPTREIIAINCSAAVEWYGSVHCFTMQLPFGIF